MDGLSSNTNSSDRVTLCRLSLAALGDLGPAARAAVPVIQPLLIDNDYMTRELATNALQRISSETRIKLIP